MCVFFSIQCFHAYAHSRHRRCARTMFVSVHHVHFATAWLDGFVGSTLDGTAGRSGDSFCNPQRCLLVGAFEFEKSEYALWALTVALVYLWCVHTVRLLLIFCTQFDNMAFFYYCLFGAVAFDFFCCYHHKFTFSLLRTRNSMASSCHFIFFSHLLRTFSSSTNICVWDKNHCLTYVCDCFFFLVYRFGLTRAVHTQSHALMHLHSHSIRFLRCTTHSKKRFCLRWRSVGARSNLLNKLKASHSRHERLIRLLESHRTHATVHNEHKSNALIVRPY